jgi:hypothetical protein
VAGNDDRWPELENALPVLAARYPQATAKTKLRPMGFLDKLLGGYNNVATTDLDGTIAYNKAAAMRDKLNPDQLLAHELQHVNQNMKRTLLQNILERVKQSRLPWESRPDEVDAMAAEYPVRGFRRLLDVNLPAEPKATAMAGAATARTARGTK